MFIRNCLTPAKSLNIVHPDDTIQTVLAQMEGHLSLPCTAEDGEFIGLVSKRTIFETWQQEQQRGVSYQDFISQSVEPCVDTSIQPLTIRDQFEDTIDFIIRHPFVPIVEHGKLLGIVKRGDVNRALSIAFATNVESHRLLLGLAEVEGALFRLFSVTHKLGVNVITAIPFDAEDNALNRRLILKVEKSAKLDQLVDQLEKAGYLIIEVD